MLADKDFKRVPLAQLTTPPTKGTFRCIANHWWAVTANDEALFYKPRGQSFGSPQCNSARSVIDHCLANLAPCAVRAEFVPVAYMPHQCEQ